MMNLTFCHALLRSDELCCLFNQSGVAVARATNAINMRQREALTVSIFFLSLHLDVINPTASTHQHFVLSLDQEIKLAAHQSQQ